MSEEFFGDRRKALEDAFFAKHNEQLKQKLREDDPHGPSVMPCAPRRALPMRRCWISLLLWISGVRPWQR